MLQRGKSLKDKRLFIYFNVFFRTQVDVLVTNPPLACRRWLRTTFAGWRTRLGVKMIRFRRLRARIARDEDGGATVEFVLWLPIFMVVVALIVDSTMLLQTQSRFFDLARNASRQVATGAMTEAEAKNYVLTTFGNDSSFQAEVETDQTGTLVTTTISVPFRKVMIMSGKFGSIGDNVLTASISMVKEASSEAGS